MPNLPAPLLAPWAITEEGLQLVCAVASRDSFFADVRQKALQARDGQPLTNARNVLNRSGVAVIPVNGPLFRHAGLMTEISGATSYEQLRKDLQAALDDSAVKAIVFDIDSPGGEVTGCGELSQAIFEARSQKRIIAYASGMACSAAYWIASACDTVVADPSAMLGSIGVRQTLVDHTKQDELAGVKKYTIVSSASPYKVVDPASASDRDRVRATLNDMAAVFISDVARNRGVTGATVKVDFGQGDVMVGKAAVAAGLADRVGDFESLLSELSPGAQMNKSKNAAVGAEAKMANAKCSRCERDMDDDDDMYCIACNGGADAAAMSQVLAVTGKSTAVEALGVLTAWKELAGEASALKEQIKAQQLAAESAQFDAEIAGAKASGLLAKSDEHKRNKAALAHKGKPGALEGLRSFLAALDPLSAPSAHAGNGAVAPKADTPVAATGLSAAEMDVLKAINAANPGAPLTAEKYLAHKSLLKNPQIPAEEK